MAGAAFGAVGGWFAVADFQPLAGSVDAREVFALGLAAPLRAVGIVTGSHECGLLRKAARVFLYGLLIVSALTAVYWGMHNPDRAVEVVVSVLIITCPCALALAVPTVMTAAQSALAERHVLVIQPEAIEKLAKVNQYVFDKTGTLTEDVQTLNQIHLTDAARAPSAVMVFIARASSRGAGRPRVSLRRRPDLPRAA